MFPYDENAKNDNGPYYPEHMNHWHHSSSRDKWAVFRLSLSQAVDIVTQIFSGSSPYNITSISWVDVFRTEGRLWPTD
jgi:hypothetical protein